jgi:Fe-S oxidoreductase
MPGQRDCYDGWEDTAVPPAVLGDYLRELRALFDRYDYSAGIYGHFGQGCIHTRIDFDLKSAQGIAQFRAFVEQAADLVVKYGGSLSGEHGDGQARGELLPRMFGAELVGAFRQFKAIWDPTGRMNPGKVVDPYRLDENLRLVSPGGAAVPAASLWSANERGGRDARTPRPAPATHFAYAEDGGDFALAMERCIGIGECRKLGGGTMCPSYMATLEEQHSTRGRARLLFEMLRDGPLRDGWHSREVKGALDLCLACKGCKSECPANVDMATYKAEFLSRFYEHHLRPRTAHTLGLVFRWTRLAARAPAVANFFTQTPGIAALAKAVAGIAPRRRIPRFADESFVSWFRSREAPSMGTPFTLTLFPRGGEGKAFPRTPAHLPNGGEGARVVLWPDTFNNHFRPETARAAVEVLEDAGFEVLVPARPLCCGRPLYDYGRLDLAKRMLREILDTLRPHLEADVPVVVLEPSCLAVFRDELPNLMPDDPLAQRLRQGSLLLSEFLEKHAPGCRLPTLARQALVHVHCHQRAVLGASADVAVLARLGIDYRLLDAGCCGMAGAFGFEREHYDVSMQIGERALLPAVRQADDDTLIIADGFSCREQIEQATGRRALHLAEVIQLARQGSDSPRSYS